MPRWSERPSPWLAAGLLLVAPAARGEAPSPKGALELARVRLVERKVDLGRKNAPWQAAVEGEAVTLGDTLRTGPDALARLELAWMALTLSSQSTLRFPDGLLLQATLEGGRALLEAPALDALKLVTGEAEVRGRGRAVVRRSERSTLVTCLAGRFVVASARAAVTLVPGEGTVVAAGQAPSTPQRVPAPPTQGLWPARDPVFVAPSEPLELRWRGGAAGYQLELLPVGSEVVLLQRDVAAPPARIEVPWPGAFRWRVSARDARGLEGLPSAEGLIAVDAR